MLRENSDKRFQVTKVHAMLCHLNYTCDSVCHVFHDTVCQLYFCACTKCICIPMKKVINIMLVAFKNNDHGKNKVSTLLVITPISHSNL